MFPTLFLPVTSKGLARSLAIFLSLLLISCSSPSGSPLETSDGTPGQEEAPTLTPPLELSLQVAADRNPPYVFGLTAKGKAGDALQIVILETIADQDGTVQHVPISHNGAPAFFSISPSFPPKTPLGHPKALLAVRDRVTESLQRLFIVYEGSPENESSHSLSEVLIRLDKLDTVSPPLEMGRVFSVPVHGTLDGLRLNRNPEGTQLTIHVAALAGDTSQPVVLIYDITSTATKVDPVDILMVPLN